TLDEVLHREQPVAVARCVLEALLRRGIVHLLFELTLDRLRVAGEELDDAVDDRAVVLLRDVADARRQAALDVVIETRDAGVASRLRAFARTVRKDAAEDVERFAHLLRFRVRAEVPAPGAMTLAREQ